MFELFWAEIIKLRKDKALLWALLGFLGSPAMVALMFLFGRSDLIKSGSWTTASFAGQTETMLAFLLGPMMLAVVGAQLVTVEYRQKTLKGLLPLPVPLSGLFAVKAVLGCAALGLALLATAGVTILAPAVMGIPPSWRLIQDVLRDFSVLWPAFLPMLIFAMLAALISKNFVVPLATSAVALVAGILAASGGRGQYFWTAIPFMLVGGKVKLAFLGARLSVSLAYAAGFLAAGSIWAGMTRRPE